MKLTHQKIKLIRFASRVAINKRVYRKVFNFISKL
jgi:hypothetical protein